MIGKPLKRLDGPAKSTGRAKYSSDLKPKDLLFAAYLHSPYAHARVTSIDTSEAEKIARREGRACGRAGRHRTPVGRAWKSPPWPPTTEERARDAVRKIKVEYEVLPHLVKEDDLAKAGARGKVARRAGRRRSRQGLPGRRSGVRRQVRHPRDQPLLPGAARRRHSVAGRHGDGLALHAGCHHLGQRASRPTSRWPPPISR